MVALLFFSFDGLTEEAGFAAPLFVVATAVALVYLAGDFDDFVGLLLLEALRSTLICSLAAALAAPLDFDLTGDLLAPDAAFLPAGVFAGFLTSLTFIEFFTQRFI